MERPTVTTCCGEGRLCLGLWSWVGFVASSPPMAGLVTWGMRSLERLLALNLERAKGKNGTSA